MCLLQADLNFMLYIFVVCPEHTCCTPRCCRDLIESLLDLSKHCWDLAENRRDPTKSHWDPAANQQDPSEDHCHLPENRHHLPVNRCHPPNDHQHHSRIISIPVRIVSILWRVISPLPQMLRHDCQQQCVSQPLSVTGVLKSTQCYTSPRRGPHQP